MFAIYIFVRYAGLLGYVTTLVRQQLERRDKDLRTGWRWIACEQNALKYATYTASCILQTLSPSFSATSCFFFPPMHVQQQRPSQSSPFYIDIIISLQKAIDFCNCSALCLYSAGNTSESPPGCCYLDWDLWRYLKLFNFIDRQRHYLLILRRESWRGIGRSDKLLWTRTWTFGFQKFGEYFDKLRSY